LADHAEGWLPAVRWGVAAAVCFPILALLARSRSGALTRGVVASAGTVVCAAALSFAFGWAGFDALLLLWVPAALLLRALRADQRSQAAGLLLLGLVGAAWVQPQGWGSWLRAGSTDAQSALQGDAVVTAAPVSLPASRTLAPAAADAAVVQPAGTAMAELDAAAATRVAGDGGAPSGAASGTVVQPGKRTATLGATECAHPTTPLTSEASAACSNAY
jgi:hypothetical protein